MMIELELRAVYNQSGDTLDLPEIMAALNMLDDLCVDHLEQEIDANGDVYYFMTFKPLTDSLRDAALQYILASIGDLCDLRDATVDWLIYDHQLDAFHTGVTYAEPY